MLDHSARPTSTNSFVRCETRDWLDPRPTASAPTPARRRRNQTSRASTPPHSPRTPRRRTKTHFQSTPRSPIARASSPFPVRTQTLRPPFAYKSRSSPPPRTRTPTSRSTSPPPAHSVPHDVPTTRAPLRVTHDVRTRPIALDTSPFIVSSQNVASLASPQSNLSNSIDRS